jgi:hypothetical protein
MGEKPPGDIAVVGAFVGEGRQLNDIAVGSRLIPMDLDPNTQSPPKGCGNDRKGILQRVMHDFFSLE